MYKPDHPHNKRGYIREHRLVVESIIGKYLFKENDVHHINKIRSDNRANNLMVFSNRSAHIRYERGGIVNQSEIIFDGRS